MDKKIRTKKKRNKWVHYRHKVMRNIVYAILYPYARIKFGAKIDKFKEQGDRQYLIVMNHQTSFDQFFTGMVFKGAVYYVASEDLFNNGIFSKFMKWAVAPIPIKKQATDVGAVMNCKRVIREGGTIAISPEGNRTYGGRTGYMKEAICGLVRVLKVPLAILRIEGGYGVQPRWSDVVRKGKMHVYVKEVLEVEDYMKMSDAELYEYIKQALYIDESKTGGEFYHKKLAEYLERAMYVCPHCGLSEFESKNDIVTCKKCGMQLRYMPDKQLKCEKGEFPFRYVADWYEYQCNYICKLDLAQYKDKKLYSDHARISEIIPGKKRIPLDKKGNISLYGNKIVLMIKGKETVLDFDNLKVATVLGRNKLNLYYDDKVYQVKGVRRFNALKYVNLFYRYDNIKNNTGDNYGQFLGL